MRSLIKPLDMLNSAAGFLVYGWDCFFFNVCIYKGACLKPFWSSFKDLRKVWITQRISQIAG